MNENTCFEAGTLVHTKEGLKPIEEIRVGNWVLSYPDDLVPPRRLREAHEYTYRQVTRTLVHEDKSICEVIVLDLGNNAKETLRVTSDHPIFVKNQGWIPAGDLNFKTVLVTAAFANLVVADVSNTSERARVYNFEVEEFNTYYVGELGVWVHNKGGKRAKMRSHV